MPDTPLTLWGPENGGNCEFHWEGDYLQSYSISDVGKRRPHNEDSCIMYIPEDAEYALKKGYFFAVADGMGGASAGEYASHLALHSLAKLYYEGKNGSIPELLTEALEKANLLVFNEAACNPEYEGMGTTLSSVVIYGNHAYVTQVGDSRVYIYREDLGLSQITDDHSLVAEQVRNGYITEEDAKNHSLKNLITRAVGIKEAVAIDQFVVRLEVGDTILICSDGLTNMIDDQVIAAALQVEALQGAARLLIGRALERGGTDNITVTLMRVTATPPRTKPYPGANVFQIARPGFFTRLKKIFYFL